MKKNLPLILILIIGIALRFYHNLGISLWHDEAFSALLIKYPWSEMMYGIGLDVHPPMYYIFLRFWHYVFGDSLLSLRGFTVFFGVGTIWAAWLFVKEAFKDEKMALWAAVLVALNPFQIEYASEARMYTMGAFFAILAAYFLIKALNRQKKLAGDISLNMPNLPADIDIKRSMLLSYIGFVLSIVVMIYTHYYLLFTAAAICFYGVVYLFFHHQGNFWEKFKWLILSGVLIVLSYLPWLKTFLFQFKQVSGGYWIPPMDRWSVPSTLWTLILGFGHDVQNHGTQKWLIALSVLFLFVVYRFLRKSQSFHKYLVLLCVLAPFFGAVLFYILAKLKGSNSSVYQVRYFLYTSTFFSVIIAAWLREMKWKWLGQTLFIIYAIINLFAFYLYWKDLNIKIRPGMDSAAKFIQSNIQEKDKLYVGSSFEFFNLKYYVSQMRRTGVPRPLLYSGGRKVENMLHFEGTAILTNNDLVLDFNQGLNNADTVWLLWTNGFGGQKPETPKNWVKIDEKEYPEVRPYVGTNIYITEYKVN